MSQEIKYYTVGDEFSIQHLADGIKSIMEEAKCVAQVFTTAHNACVVQCRNDVADGMWRKLTGNVKALSVSLTLDNNQLAVQMGNANWIDKVAAGGIALFLFWPFFLTAGYGIYSQRELENKICAFIDVSLGETPINNY